MSDNPPSLSAASIVARSDRRRTSSEAGLSDHPPNQRCTLRDRMETRYSPNFHDGSSFCDDPLSMEHHHNAYYDRNLLLPIPHPCNWRRATDGRIAPPGRRNPDPGRIFRPGQRLIMYLRDPEDADVDVDPAPGGSGVCIFDCTFGDPSDKAHSPHFARVDELWNEGALPAPFLHATYGRFINFLGSRMGPLWVMMEHIRRRTSWATHRFFSRFFRRARTAADVERNVGFDVEGGYTDMYECAPGPPPPAA